MLSLGIDIGSSSVKVSIYDPQAGKVLAAAQHPATEMQILAQEDGWAEQEADWWWDAFLHAYRQAVDETEVDTSAIQTIGVAYQMHGLVCLDKNGRPLRPAIIWCDSRAVPYGRHALEALGKEYALHHLLNSPGNFTAAKLAWVKENEPVLFDRIDHICLPGDYLAYQLTGTLTTTVSGLSEGVFYDFVGKRISQELLAHFAFSDDIFPEVKPSFASHGHIRPDLAKTLGLPNSAQVTYKAGDQPNNALALNVLKPGEIAATAGTSGVVYGVSDQLFIDPSQRVNSFAHVNYTADDPRIGVLLCINGTGIANAWAQKWTKPEGYRAMNELAAAVVPGSEGLQFWPFGNGAERMLDNEAPGASLVGLQFNRHQPAHLYRAVQEGVAYAFHYGMEAFAENNIELKVIRAGQANMFLSPLFGQILASITGVFIELYDTDGPLGAARGALVGIGACALEEAFRDLQVLQTYEPDQQLRAVYLEHYERWKAGLAHS